MNVISNKIIKIIMSFQQVLSIVESSEVFKRFKKQNSNAKLVAGFFVLDFLSNDEKKSLDYKIQETNKIFTFELDKNNEVVMKQDKLIDSPNIPQLQEIQPSTRIEVEELRAIAEKQAIENNIKAKFHKIIAVLQKHNQEQIWNLTCMLEGLIILNILINCDNGNIIKFERKSMMDFVKKV
jgi:hypothetical protein